jgi:hypothetical protein
MAANPDLKSAPALPPSPAATSSSSPFDPTAFWAQGQQAFTRMMADSLARWQAFADQYAAIESQVASQAQQAVSSWAQLAKDAITYGQQLSAEARKLAADATKKLSI